VHSFGAVQGAPLSRLSSQTLAAVLHQASAAHSLSLEQLAPQAPFMH